MSKETAKKLIAELQTNEELKAKITGITDPAEMVKIAASAGYDVTVEEMLEAEKEFKAERSQKTKLSVDEIESVAGGEMWTSETAKDGHELSCAFSYHHYDYQKDENEWCKETHYCSGHNKKYEDPSYCCPFTYDMDTKTR
ncbi:MAG: Nif11-like leader peptide family natural product precursor [Ruminiclostridium sp.]|nr:Nif11-like leader peptide family natural product precursor [Ruminiclostridium sp.]